MSHHQPRNQQTRNDDMLQPDALAQLASQVHAQVSQIGVGASNPPPMATYQQHQHHLMMGNANATAPGLTPPRHQVLQMQGGGQHQLPSGTASHMGMMIQNQHQQMQQLMWQQQNTNFPPGTFPAGGFSAEMSAPTPVNQMSASNLAPPMVRGQQQQQFPAPVSDIASVSRKGTKKSSRVTASSSAAVGGAKRGKSSKANGRSGGSNSSTCSSDAELDDDIVPDAGASSSNKVQQSRERNREHARSTRMRKKAYIQKLRDMAQGLRAVQTEEIRQRRISMQNLLEAQKVRRTVVKTVLHYHATYERDAAKWSVLLEDSFWMKQPVTPFRSFRRSQVERDCRVLRGVDAIICDAASIAVMVERIGCHNARWRRIKRSDFLDEDFLNKEITVGQAPESSLSSESSTDSSSSVVDETKRVATRKHSCLTSKDEPTTANSAAAKTVSSSCESVSQYPTSATGSGVRQIAPEEVLQKVSRAVKVNDNGTAKRQKTGREQNHPASVSLRSGPQLSIATRSSQFLPLRLGNTERTAAYYCINDDDMIVIEDVMMCPFVLRTRNAISCGALAECVIPGMLRVQFSSNNKLQSMELVFDAMGVMQQLDSANGGDVTAQVIPGSLEMALMHCQHEARVITEAKHPYCILHVNEAWTRLTRYTQVEVEGKHFLPLLEGTECNSFAGAATPAQPCHSLEEVASGRSGCSTSLHYRKSGKPFVDFMCSYPLTNANDEITHLLHVNMELPEMGTFIS